MKTRYRLIRRGTRGGKFYCVDTQTGRRTSLQTSSEDEARQLVDARNMAIRHSSKAVHRAYAKKAQVVVPPLEEYEKRNARPQPIIPVLITDMFRN